MEAKINIAEILRDKPENTKLYSPLFGDVYLSCIQDSIIKVTHHGGITKFFNNGRYYNYPESEQVLFPSKEMRDWSKFSWRKGDVLTNSRGVFYIFKEFSGYPYTTFIATFVNNVDFVTNGSIIEATQEWNKASNENAEKYIGYITADLEKANRRLNLETLEIEKAQHEFKDGDIITFKDRIIIIYNTSIEKSPTRTGIYYHACLKEGKLTVNEYLISCGFGEGWYSSTEEEKHQLFDALAKEGKAWDAEKKQIVDLKPKWTPKPFDRVITRGDNDSIWTANIFSHIDRYGQYVAIGCIGGYPYCIPYNEETVKLIGTTDEWKGDN